MTSHFQFNVQSHIFSLVFKVVVCFQFRRSEPSSFLSFGVQSHHHFSVSAFKATIVFQFRHSKPPSLFSFNVQSHHHVFNLKSRFIVHFQFSLQSHHITLSVQRLEPHLQFGVQRHHLFPVQAFRAIIASQFRRSERPYFSISAFRTTIVSQFRCLEPPSLFKLGVQSNRRVFSLTFRVAFSISAFRAIIITSQFRRSKPSSLLSLGIQSHHLLSYGVQSLHHSQFGVQSHVFGLEFKATISLQLSVQSRHIFSVTTLRIILLSQAFKSTISLSVRHLEQDLHFDVQSHCLFQFNIQSRVFSLAFRAIVQFGVQIHIFSLAFRVVVHSQAFRTISQLGIQMPSYFFNLAFRDISQLGIQSHHFPLVQRSELHSQHLELSYSFSSVFRATLLAFRVVIFFQFNIQSYLLHFRCLEP